MATKRGTLTIKQAKCIRLIKDAVGRGEDISNDLLTRCHDEAYELGGDRKTASTMAGQNMKRATFLSALSLDSTEAQSSLKDVLWGWLLNWEKDKQLAMKAATLLAKAGLGEKVHVTYDEQEFSTKSTEDLEFYGRNGRWPDPREMLSNQPVSGKPN